MSLLILLRFQVLLMHFFIFENQLLPSPFHILLGIQGQIHHLQSSQLLKVFVVGQILKGSISQVAKLKSIDGWPYKGQSRCERVIS